MARIKNIDYSRVDWNLSDADIARQLSVATKSVWQKRKRLGIPPSRGKGNPNPSLHRPWQKSSRTKAITDINYVFSSSGSSWRRAVINHYGPRCMSCNYYKPPVRNHCHHIHAKKDGGKNTISNAIVLCSRCHDEVHAGIQKSSEIKISKIDP